MLLYLHQLASCIAGSSSASLDSGTETRPLSLSLLGRKVDILPSSPMLLSLL